MEDGDSTGEGRSYWLDLFSAKTWAEFVAAGQTVSGFREGRCRSVNRMRVGDYLICYLTGASRFIGILEVTSAPYRDETPIWQDEAFPCRVHVRSVASLTPETGVPVTDILDRFSWAPRLRSPI